MPSCVMYARAGERAGAVCCRRSRSGSSGRGTTRFERSLARCEGLAMAAVNANKTVLLTGAPALPLEQLTSSLLITTWVRRSIPGTRPGDPVSAHTSPTETLTDRQLVPQRDLAQERAQRRRPPANRDQGAVGPRSRVSRRARHLQGRRQQGRGQQGSSAALLGEDEGSPSQLGQAAVELAMQAFGRLDSLICASDPSLGRCPFPDIAAVRSERWANGTPWARFVLHRPSRTASAPLPLRRQLLFPRFDHLARAAVLAVEGGQGGRQGGRAGGTNRACQFRGGDGRCHGLGGVQVRPCSRVVCAHDSQSWKRSL